MTMAPLKLLALSEPAPVGTRFRIEDGSDKRIYVEVIHECSAAEAFALEPATVRAALKAAGGARVYWVAIEEVRNAAEV